MTTVGQVEVASTISSGKNTCMNHVFIGIGSNLGEREVYIDLARREISELADQSGGGLDRVSGIYETDPVGPVPQGKYLNAVVEISTNLSAGDLLRQLRKIEQHAGRVEEHERPVWGPRTLDLDILFYGDAIFEGPGLIIPHPRCHERWFVLKPMCDLAPQMIHPVIEQSMAQLLQNVEALNHA